MHAAADSFPPWEIREAKTVLLMPVENMAAQPEAQVQEGVKLHASVGK